MVHSKKYTPALEASEAGAACVVNTGNRFASQNFDSTLPSTRSIIFRRSEAALQKTIVQLLTLTGAPGLVFFSIPNEGRRTLNGGAELKRMGLRPGAADLCLVIGGRAHFLELKSSVGKQSPEQIAFEADAVAAGANYAVAHSIDGALNVLSAWGALRHRRQP